MNNKQKNKLLRIIATLILAVALQLSGIDGWPRLVAFIAVYLLIGYDILRKAGRGILEGEVCDENFLMSVATIGAFALAIYNHSGDYLEAIAVMLFYQTGEFFESYAVGKSRRNIAALMDIRPDYANIEVNGKIEKVDPSTVTPGSIIIVSPGEKVPIDGVVEDGTSSLNTSALTGESLPRAIGKGDEIVSGSVNLSGQLRIRTSRDFSQSTVSRILQLVEDASSRKARSENFITKFARIYTPAVCLAALALAMLPPLFLILFEGFPFTFATFDTWVYRSLTFLVISCPCALVISIPLTFFAGIGGASRQGILVKGANILETLSKVDTVVFDKTGTLTKGVFEVSAIHDSNDNSLPDNGSQMIEQAALVESSSTHPIAKSIIEAYNHPIDHRRISNLQEISGHGVKATVDGREVAAGNDKLMVQLGLTPAECHDAGTIVHLAVNNQYQGHIVMGDVAKENAALAISQLYNSGVKKTVMLTGDTPAVGKQVARRLKINEAYCSLLPAGKVEKLEEIIHHEPPGEKVAFVGDGINDAPVLTRADVGIAMGALGSDAAIEAADVVIMDDDLTKISKAIRISRKTLAIVRQNIALAIGIKAICLILGVVGIVNMWLAIFADVGVMVIAVANAIRAMRVNNV